MNALACQLLGDGVADAFAGTGYDGGSAVQPQIHDTVTMR